MGYVSLIDGHIDEDNVTPCCGTCEHWFEVRRRPTYQDVLTHVCTYAISNVIDYIIEVDENDMCECYMKRKYQPENEV